MVYFKFKACSHVELLVLPSFGMHLTVMIRAGADATPCNVMDFFVETALPWDWIDEVDWCEGEVSLLVSLTGHNPFPITTNSLDLLLQ